MKIADFGLSQLIAPNERLLKVGGVSLPCWGALASLAPASPPPSLQVCGTWAYAAPEMSDPSRPGYDCRFDVFSFGVILCECWGGGRHPV